MKKTLLALTLLTALPSFANCTLYIEDQPREDERKLHNTYEVRFNKNADKAEKLLKKSMKRKGFVLVANKEEARFTIPEYGQTCGYSQEPLEEQTCVIGFGNIELVDDIDPSNSRVYGARDFGIEVSSSFDIPIMISASSAFKKTRPNS